MKLSVCIVAALALEAAAQSNYPPGCQQQAAIDDVTFNQLITDLTATPNEIVRWEKWQKWLTDVLDVSGLGLLGFQTVAAIACFQNNIYKTDLAGTVQNRSLGLTYQDVIAVISSTSNGILQMDMLKAIVNSCINCIANVDTVVAVWSNTISQREARAGILNSKPFDCVWGSVQSETHFVFLVDLSGSMDTPVRTANGTNTRLGFVSTALQQTLSNLAPTQLFNVVTFCDSIQSWQPGIVPATPQNIQLAQSYGSAWRTCGGTNMLAGLNRAAADPAVTAIFLLSDGAPTDAAPQTIVARAEQWGHRVNPVAFMAGSAGAWMEQLAIRTGGVFRNIIS